MDPFAWAAETVEPPIEDLLDRIAEGESDCAALRRLAEHAETTPTLWRTLACRQWQIGRFERAVGSLASAAGTSIDVAAMRHPPASEGRAASQSGAADSGAAPADSERSFARARHGAGLAGGPPSRAESEGAPSVGSSRLHGGGASTVDASLGRRPSSRSATRSWGGWLAAAGVAMAWIAFGAPRGPAPGDAASQAREARDARDAAAVPTIQRAALTATDAIEAYLEAGRAEGVVIGELPGMPVVEWREAPDGTFEVVYLRQFLERRHVPAFFKFDEVDEFGRAVPRPVSPGDPRRQSVSF